MAAGRKGKYDSHVKPHISKIKDMVAAGATDAEVAKSLGIAVSTLCEYKNKYKEFSDAFARGRQEVVCEIKAALLKKALGFEYEEKEAVKKGDEVVSVRIFKRYCVPSESAAGMLLRNYDPEWNDRDTATTELKKKEMELRQKMTESEEW